MDRAATRRVERAVARRRALAERAVAADGVAPGVGSRAAARAVVAGWGATRLAATTVAAPLLAAGVGVRALQNQREAKRIAAGFGAWVDALAAGRQLEPGSPGTVAGHTLRVARLPAARRYLFTSDLHRGMPGRMDWPGAQGTTELSRLALAWYADAGGEADGWHLVENGDVEDFWLTGGSAYGVVYDVARLASPVFGRSRRRWLATLYGDHLDRIVEHNRATYDLIEHGFHRPGRYHRVIGNHDDVYLDEAVVDRLRAHHPGLRMWDALVLEGEVGAVGVVTHGHQADAWNMPRRDRLGKLCTWVAGAVLDAPAVPVRPGMATVDESRRLLEGALANELMPVGRWLGLNRDLYTLDEVRLLEGCRTVWGDDAERGLHRGPRVVLGHTHVPLHAPHRPAAGGTGDPGIRRHDGAAWSRYHNSGSAILPGLFTALEWDGTGGGDPHVRLVVWRFADDDEDVGDRAVTHHDGRAVVVDVLEPDTVTRTLRAVPGLPGTSGHAPGAAA